MVTTPPPDPNPQQIDPSAAARALGRLGGSAATAAQKEAARRNGKLGGRPRKKTAASPFPFTRGLNLYQKIAISQSKAWKKLWYSSGTEDLRDDLRAAMITVFFIDPADEAGYRKVLEGTLVRNLTNEQFRKLREEALLKIAPFAAPLGRIVGKYLNSLRLGGSIEASANSPVIEFRGKVHGAGRSLPFIDAVTGNRSDSCPVYYVKYEIGTPNPRKQAIQLDLPLEFPDNNNQAEVA